MNFGAQGPFVLNRLWTAVRIRVYPAAALKTGTKFAAELLAARVRGDRSLSTPQAAGGGGQRPAFIGIYRPLKSAAAIGGVATSHLFLPGNIQRSGRHAAG